jgi:hypothetical protein
VESRAATERLRHQNGNLKTQVKDFGLSSTTAQRVKEAASEAKAQSDERIAQLEWEVEELKSRSGILLEAEHHRGIDVRAFDEERRTL